MNPDPSEARKPPERPAIKLVRTPFSRAVARAAQAGRIRPAHSMGRMVHGSRLRTAYSHSLLPLWGVIAGISVVTLLAVLAVPSWRAKLHPPAPPPLVPPVEDVQASLRQLESSRVSAAPGGLSAEAPAGWEQVTGPDAKPYDLTFQNPRGVSISMMATPVKYDDLRQLSADIRRRERERQMSTTLEVIRLGDRQVIQRKVDLGRQQVLALDFVENRVAYHSLCCAPKKFYDTYEPLFLEVVKSLRAGTP